MSEATKYDRPIKIRERVISCILICVILVMFSGCLRNISATNHYGAIREFADYVNSNAEIEPLYWSVDIDKDKKILNIFIEMKKAEPFSKIDSIRIAANKFLEDNPTYFLNEYLIRILVTDTEPAKLYYAKFSNTEEMGIPAYKDKGKPQYESLCAIEVLVSEDDLEYISGLDDIVSIRFHPTKQQH